MRPQSAADAGGTHRSHGGHFRPGPALLALAALLAAAPASAQDGGGATVARVKAASDTAFSYALYLPPGHDPSRRWPAILLMDPRGRALVPLERFRDGAAELGFVLISSYDTSSDEPTSGVDTQAAVEVLLNETVDRLGLDPDRLYLAGFSGTARIGWTIAALNPDVIAGVAAFGAGTASAATLLTRAYGEAATVGGYYGGAGLEDFNFAEVWATDRRLAAQDRYATVRFYPGGHAWPPPEVAREALEWFALYGQRSGRVPRDSSWIAGRYAAWIDRAAALERAGNRYEAWRAFRRAVTGFDGLCDTSVARSAVERLAGDRDVERDRRSVEHWLEWEAEARDRVADGLALLEAPTLPRVGSLARAVGLPGIRRAADSGDTVAVHAAARVRAQLLALTTFYLFRDFVGTGRFERALRALELAQRADPGWPALCPRFRQLPPSEQRARSPLRTACGKAEDAARGALRRHREL